MRNTFGNRITVTLFGESHGPAVGAVLDGIPAGVRIDEDKIRNTMERRRAKGRISTARKEADEVEFLSGLKDGYTEGTPIAILIRNTNVRRNDYAEMHNVARPSHADYTGHVKYRGYEDASGGGHFSGRLTAPLTAAGAVCMSMLEEKGILIGTHIKSLYNLEDIAFRKEALPEDILSLQERSFPVLSEEKGEAMKALIEKTAEEGDSLGGVLETVITGLEAGIGEPWFDSFESMMAHAMFSIPAVKAVAFGSGYEFAGMKGSQANDAFIVQEGKIETKTNHNGGINGGITNGMPVTFETVVKPTPSISVLQKTVNYVTKEETELSVPGRHDPAIIHRAAVVTEAMAAIVTADLLVERYGQLYFGGEK